MKIFHYILCLGLTAIAHTSHAAPSIQEQIHAVNKAHKEERQIEKSKEASTKAHKAAQTKKVQTAKVLKEKQKLDAKKHLQTRSEKHEDALRDLELEAMRIELEEKRARAKRTNDFIDKELEREGAKTDLVQSEADSKRNISEGTKQFLQSSSVQVEK
jgi:hypothetical protein